MTLKSTLENANSRVQRDWLDMWPVLNPIVNRKRVSELCFNAIDGKNNSVIPV